MQHGVPQLGQYSSQQPGSSQQGALQSSRPVVPSSITAPSTVPTQQNMNHPNISSRPSTASHTHNYSRSSPAGMDQPRYGPFISTPENSRYAPQSSHRYTSSQSGHGDSIYSPLGLADIRPLADSGETEPQSANPFASDRYASSATNSSHLAPWPVYALDWCKWPAQHQNGGNSAGKIAIGSYVEDGHNYIQVLEAHATIEPEVDAMPGVHQYGLEYTKTAEATHSYPVTRILWEPASTKKQSTDLLATSGDHLRLWSLPTTPGYTSSNSITRSSTGQQQAPAKLTPLALLSNSKSPEHTAPLTSLDWNTVSPSLIITSSIDTTCTIWDIPTLTAKTQLIAHDKEVFDVRFCANSVDVFASCGADGSVRMFDLRSLEHSTIIYEPSEKANESKSQSPGSVSPSVPHASLPHAPPLLRLAASPHDFHLLATFSQDSSLIRILDVRQPGQALLELKGHASAINCLEWSSTRRGTLASGGDDSLVLIWDLLNQSNNKPGSNTMPTTSESQQQQQQQQQQQTGQAATAPSTATANGGPLPIASWQCDYEVSNLSWAPQNGLPSQSSEWLGVSGGRGLWGVCL